MILTTASRIKNDVRTRSAVLNTDTKRLSGLFKGLSKARRMLEIAINRRMNMSKAWLFANLETTVLIGLSGPRRKRELP
jgi:hypothetical protein